MVYFDIVVVGAGVAGAIVADYLAHRGHKVIVLDAGPDEQNRNVLTESYFASAKKSFNSPYLNSRAALKSTDNFVQKGPIRFGSKYERRVGGTTWHWLGLTPRLMPSDFRMQSIYKVGKDWPINYDELEPWYSVAEKELGVAGDNKDDHGSPRSGSFSFPELRQSVIDLAIKSAVSGKQIKGIKLDVTAHRAARNPELCQGSGSCMPLCPTGAKYEAITHINRARSKGAVIQPNSVATLVVVNETGNVSSIEYKTWEGTEHSVVGKFYVLAANAMETSKLLLMSAASQGPIANRSDQVGRNLMDHLMQISFATAAEPMNLYTGPQSTSAIRAFCDSPLRSREAAFRIDISNAGVNTFGGPDHTVATLINQGLTGAALRSAVLDQANRELVLLAGIEQLPHPENRILLSKSERDALGLPKPEIYYSYDDYTNKGIATAKSVNSFVFEQLSATGINHMRQTQGAGHIMGTTRMGDNPTSSVVNANLQCHDHPNLFVVGSAVFPTGATANPTLTIAALSLRLAKHIHTRKINEP